MQNEGERGKRGGVGGAARQQQADAENGGFEQGFGAVAAGEVSHGGAGVSLRGNFHPDKPDAAGVDDNVGVCPGQGRDGQDDGPAASLALLNRLGGKPHVGPGAVPVLPDGGGKAVGLLHGGFGGSVGPFHRFDSGAVLCRFRSGDGAVLFRLHHGFGAVGPSGGLRLRAGGFVDGGGDGGAVGLFDRCGIGGGAGRRAPAGRGTPAGGRPSAAGTAGGGTAAGGGKRLPDHLATADGAGLVPGPVLGRRGGPVHHPVSGGVGGVAALFAVRRDGTAGGGTVVPVVGGVGFPGGAPGVGMAGSGGRDAAGSPNGV